MSQQDVDTVKALMAAVERRDADLLAAVTTPDLEWFPVFAARVGGMPYRGRRGIEAFLREIEETWEEFEPVPEEYREIAGCVVGLGRLRTRGRSSGAPADSPWAAVYDLSDGRVSRIRTYLSHDEALEVVAAQP